MAPQWDAGLVVHEDVVGTILDNAGVGAGRTVLDVACGTGVMIPYYLERGVPHITAIDICPKMAELARAKFPQENVEIVCGDVETTDFGRLFDCIVVYNAFPHFQDPERLIKYLAGLLAPGGTLTVAHGMSRDAVNAHHRGCAVRVSNGLMSAEELAEVFSKYLKVSAVISDDRMYQVAGTRD